MQLYLTLSFPNCHRPSFHRNSKVCQNKGCVHAADLKGNYMQLYLPPSPLPTVIPIGLHPNILRIFHFNSKSPNVHTVSFHRHREDGRDRHETSQEGRPPALAWMCGLLTNIVSLQIFWNVKISKEMACRQVCMLIHSCEKRTIIKLQKRPNISFLFRLSGSSFCQAVRMSQPNRPLIPIIHICNHIRTIIFYLDPFSGTRLLKEWYRHVTFYRHKLRIICPQLGSDLSKKGWKGGWLFQFQLVGRAIIKRGTCTPPET